MADNSEIDVTGNVSSSFSFQWLKDGSNVASETSSTISLTSSDENGSYELEGS